jgi:PKD repeat protein
VAVTKPVTVQSINGSEVTVIQGCQVSGTTNGDGAVRCVYLTNNAALIGFTLINGATRSSGDLAQEQSGGGAWCESTNAVLVNCVLVKNSAHSGCGGIYRGTLNNCVLASNTANSYGGGANASTLNNCVLSGNATAYSGGGASWCILNNCSIVANKASTSGGGAHACTLRNCILYYNTGSSQSNHAGGSLDYCCTAPLPFVGTNNITAEPQMTGISHVSVNSPCRGAGNAAYATGPDIDGEPWANPPSIGCDEPTTGALTGAVSIAIQATYSNVVPGFAVQFTGHLDGRVSASRWEFGDGTILSNRLYASHSWTTTGDYSVVLRAFNESNPNGISEALMIHVVEGVVYVALDNPNPVPPYSSWITAATNIQDAVDAAYIGGTVLVSNGVYQTGGRVVHGTLTNRVAVTKPLALRSVNGPAVTLIQGNGPVGTNAVRCVYLTSGAALVGFTLTNGATLAIPYPRYPPAPAVYAADGGGVWCESTSALVSNCVLIGNSTEHSGGGAHGGILSRCTLVANQAHSSRGASGGGAAGSVLNNCALFGNAADRGGGAAACTLDNCTLTDNTASISGGGAYGGDIFISAALRNCIVYYNSAPSSSNYAGEIVFSHCCTTPLPAGGAGNFDNVPLFADQAGDNLHLQSNSPCINAGTNYYAPAGPDMDGSPRIVGGTVDIGAYEHQSPPLLPYYIWLQDYGLSTYAPDLYADADTDRQSNWQEWRCGTDPTNALSLLRLLTPESNIPEPASRTVTWESVTNRSYFLERGTNFGEQPAFSTLATNIVGQPGTTSFTDTNATGSRLLYYRVGIQEP